MEIFLTILSSLLIAFTLLPLIKNDYWIFRIFDYPRLQKFFLSCLCLVLLGCCFDSSNMLRCILTIAMLLNVVYLLFIIAPFTPIGKKQVLRVASQIEGQHLSLMIANVYQDNTNYLGCLKEISKVTPDVILLLETDEKWEKELRQLDADYPFTVKVPIGNTYGMLLYSKLELSGAEVKYLVEKDVPSIHTKMILPGGKEIQFYAVHPTPPVPSENPRATERDKELLLVADLAKASALPVVVAGDLNDVAWSHTTELFLKMSGLLDPRRGRGFFNSFHAHYPFLRFPLDHAFISTEFKLISIRRLSNFNSDHFPIFIEIQFEEKAAAQQDSMQPDSGEVQEAQEKKAKI